MKENVISSKKLGRLTGGAYLLIIVAGLFAGLAVRGNLVNYLDPMETLQNIITNESLYRIGFLSDLLMVICDVLVSVFFYFLLRETNKGVALFAMVFRLIQSAILGANLINLYSPLLKIPGQNGTNAELANSVMHDIMVFEHGYLISGVFFAINCALMGYLLYHATLFPKALGIMLGMAAFGYFFNCMAVFVMPQLVEVSQVVMLFTAVISELSLCFYLLFKGTKSKTELSI